MTLDEAFKKYSDDTKLKRPSHLLPYNIGWLRKFKMWADPTLREIGFIIPDSFIDDANADDWEVIN